MMSIPVDTGSEGVKKIFAPKLLAFKTTATNTYKVDKTMPTNVQICSFNNVFLKKFINFTVQ